MWFGVAGWAIFALHVAAALGAIASDKLERGQRVYTAVIQGAMAAWVMWAIQRAGGA